MPKTTKAIQPAGATRAARAEGPTRGVPAILPRLVFAAGILLPGAIALAQEAERLRPPIPTDEGNPPAILTLVGGALLVALVLFAAAFPSKRGHQD